MQFYMEILIIVLLVLSVRFVYQLYQRQQQNKRRHQPSTAKSEPGIGNLHTLYDDEIIAVRKRTSEEEVSSARNQPEETKVDTMSVHVMADKNKPFLGYDLLQVLLSQGLKYGEMKIFHRYQETNGKGPRLFSVASAVEPGTFDIHQMGSQTYGGITLFMQFSGSPGIDKERFSMMCATAQELAETLRGHMLNHQRVPLTSKTANEYREKIIESINAQAVA